LPTPQGCHPAPRSLSAFIRFHPSQIVFFPALRKPHSHVGEIYFTCGRLHACRALKHSPRVIPSLRQTDFLPRRARV
jgi:hypothetical protein